MQTRNLVSRVCATALLGSLVLGGGCALAPGFKPGGAQRSNDEYTYMSTPWEPLTVTLFDRRVQTPLWTVDVPVGSKVAIRFYANKEDSGTALLPDMMRWEIFDAEKDRARLTSAMAVPGADSRLLKVSLRDEVPEMPVEDPAAPEFTDPDRDWLPVQPRRYRGVPVDGGRDGAYYRAD